MQPGWCDAAWKWNLDVIVWLSVSSVQIRLWIWMNDVADSSICSRLLVHPHLFPSPTPSAPPLSLTGLDTDTRRCRVTDSGTDSGNGRGQCMWFSHPAHNHSLCVFILVSGPQRSYCNSISGSCGSRQSGSGWYRQLVESAGNRKALYTESLLLAAAVLNSFPFTRPAVRRSCVPCNARRQSPVEFLSIASCGLSYEKLNDVCKSAISFSDANEPLSFLTTQWKCKWYYSEAFFA